MQTTFKTRTGYKGQRIQSQSCGVRELKVTYKKGKAGPKIKSSKDCEKALRNLFTERSLFCEEFILLTLNRRNSVIGYYHVSTGGVAGTVADPKIIFSIALSSLASSIILCHNHPSGEKEPSQSDIRMTKNAINAGKLLDIAVLDHIIVTDDGYYSFADNGLI